MFYQSSKRQERAAPATLRNVFDAFNSGPLRSRTGKPGNALLDLLDIDTARTLLDVACFLRRAVQQCAWPHWLGTPLAAHCQPGDVWRDLFPFVRSVNFDSRLTPNQLLGCTRAVLGPAVSVLNTSHMKLRVNFSTVKELYLDGVRSMPASVFQLALLDHNGAFAARQLDTLHLVNKISESHAILRTVGSMRLTHLHMTVESTHLAMFDLPALLPTPPRILPRGQDPATLAQPMRCFVPAFQTLVSLSLRLFSVDITDLEHLRALPVLRKLTLEMAFGGDDDLAIPFFGNPATPDGLASCLPLLTDLTLVEFIINDTLPTDLVILAQDAARVAQAVKPLRLRLVDCITPPTTLHALDALHTEGVYVNML